jgi:hypothetical protein
MISSAQKAEFEQQKIDQYDAELFQLREKIEEIEAAKAVCEKRLQKVKDDAPPTDCGTVRP